jgi:hypothetical protein
MGSATGRAIVSIGAQKLHAETHTAADLVERSVSETLTYYAFPRNSLAEGSDLQSARADL